MQATIFFYIYTLCPKKVVHQTHGAQKIELNQARSKPDTVDRPVRTLVPLCTIITVHNTVTQRELFFFNILLPPDQHHISDVPQLDGSSHHDTTQVH